MKLNKELLFQTFDEAYTYINQPTNYEKENGITIKNKRIVAERPSIKLIEVLKSDNTTTLFLFFKNSTQYDIWKFWCPNKEQLDFFNTDLRKYLILNS